MAPKRGEKTVVEEGFTTTEADDALLPGAPAPEPAPAPEAETAEVAAVEDVPAELSTKDTLIAFCEALHSAWRRDDSRLVGHHLTELRAFVETL